MEKVFKKVKEPGTEESLQLIHAPYLKGAEVSDKHHEAQSSNIDITCN
jgi:hypothetical protein